MLQETCRRGNRVIYLSDYISGSVTTYQDEPPFRALRTAFAHGYGWGLASTKSPNPNGDNVYMGTWQDVIETRAPFTEGPPVNTYTGANTGQPLGIAIDRRGVVYANEFPHNTIDVWAAPDPAPFTVHTDPPCVKMSWYQRSSNYNVRRERGTLDRLGDQA